MAIEGACLADASIFAFAQGQLRAEAVPEVERHLATCADCRSVVAETAKFLSGDDSGTRTRTSNLLAATVAGPVMSLGFDARANTAIADVPRRSAARPTDLGTPLPAAHAPRALPSGTRVSRYVISGVIGAGASGVVYRAYDPELRRNVALKLLRTDWAQHDPDATKRDGDGRAEWRGREATLPGFPAAEPDPRGFASLKARLLREAQVMAQLSHPNVVSVFDVGTYGDQVFVVLELVEGETLGHWLGERPRSWQEIRAAFTDAGRGLAAAHAVQLVHRDFKPANVLVGLDGRVRVTDFGLARPIDFDGSDPYDTAGARPPGENTEVGAGGARSPLFSMMPTEDGGLAGTPVYMAPEQFAGQRTDARTDQFSFCVALYMALYHRHPYLDLDGVRRLYSLEDLASSVRSGRVHVPVTADVPPWVFAVLRKGLAVKPQERFPSMHALLRELNAAEASRPTPGARPRSRVVFAGGAVVLGATIAAVLVLRTLVFPERTTQPPSRQGEEDRRGALASSAPARSPGAAAAPTAPSPSGGVVVTMGAASNAVPPAAKAPERSKSVATPPSAKLAIGKPRRRPSSSRTAPTATAPQRVEAREAAPRYFDGLKDPF